MIKKCLQQWCGFDGIYKGTKNDYAEWGRGTSEIGQLFSLQLVYGEKRLCSRTGYYL